MLDFLLKQARHAWISPMNAAGLSSTSTWPGSHSSRPAWWQIGASVIPFAILLFLSRAFNIAIAAYSGVLLQCWENRKPYQVAKERYR